MKMEFNLEKKNLLKLIVNNRKYPLPIWKKH